MSDNDVEDKLEVLADSYSKRILSGCYRKAKAVQDLSWKYNIPIAACYRKVKSLREAGFLKIDKKKPSRRGKKTKLYRTTLKKAMIKFEEGEFMVKFRYPNGETLDVKLDFK
ncbi:MAG: hypothetical protein ACOCZJ_00155 [Thermoplasmatota archaeon]